MGYATMAHKAGCLKEWARPRNSAHAKSIYAVGRGPLLRGPDRAVLRLKCKRPKLSSTANT